MPNPWKKARTAGLSRLVSGLARPECGASLVVQTGFPTSLADLVVKNRDRLKKPSRKKTPTAVRSVPDTVAGDDPRPPPSVHRNRAGRDDILEKSPCPPLPSSMEIKSNGTGTGSGFALLMVNLVVLMVLSIERRKLVAGITVSAFSLLFLDFMGFQVFAFLKPCSNARGSLNSVIGGFDLEGREKVPPISEVGVEGRLDSMPSDRSWEESSIDSDRQREIFPERRDLAVGQNSGPPGRSNGKKFWKMFVPKKLRRSRKEKDEKELVSNSSSISGRRGEFEGIRVVDEVINGAGDEEDVNCLSFITSTEVTNFDQEEDMDGSQEIVLKTRSESQQYVFFVIALFGLVGGKAFAVVLTVLVSVYRINSNRAAEKKHSRS